MKQPEKLENLDLVKELLGLVFEYQNKFVGTAFFEVRGQINCIQIDLHENGWYSGSNPVYSEYVQLNEESINKAISDIRSLIDNAKPFEERQKEIEAAKIAAKRKQLEELSKELNVKIVG